MAPDDPTRLPDTIRRQADDCLRHVAGTEQSFDDATAAFEPALRALIEAIREVSPRYAFDRGGRPDAIAAVRHALPAMEREIFEAVLDDHECELAAVREALYQLVLAAHRATAP